MAGTSSGRRYRYYEILGTNPHATQDEIKQAYLVLAKKLHPDVNSNPNANKEFAKINEAWGVLSMPARREEYDKSPAECPLCYTHEVIGTPDNYWRCRCCGCKFDQFGSSGILDKLENANISATLRRVVEVFQTTQCSWCEKYFTTPFLCPYKTPQSGCFLFKKLNERDRGPLIGDEKFWWRMFESVRYLQLKGDIIARCRKCGALNPNPQKLTCWKCGQDTLRCPACGLTLQYDIENNFWKCPNASCGRKFAFVPREDEANPVLPQELCPNCQSNLHYDARMLLWRCRKCRHIFTHRDMTGTTHEDETVSNGTRSMVSPKSRTKSLVAFTAIFGMIVLSITLFLLSQFTFAVIIGLIILVTIVILLSQSQMASSNP